MKVDPVAQAAALRGRLVALCRQGTKLRQVAGAMRPPCASPDLSRFKCGEHWGAARLGRLALALDELEQQQAPAVPDARPTDRAPPLDLDDAGQADSEQPAVPPAPPVAATLPAPAPPAGEEGWPAPGTIGRAIVELLAEQGPTDTGALAAALEGEEKNVRTLCEQLAKRGILRRLPGHLFPGRVFALAS